MNCFRFLGIKDIKDIEQMTIWEYNLRMKAHNLEMVDRQYEIYLAAWVNREAYAKKKAGKNKTKYVYQNWKSFFNYQERIDKITGEKEEKPETISDKLMDYERKKKDG